MQLTPTNSLQETSETAKRAETDRTKGSHFSTPSKQKASMHLRVLRLAGEVGLERACVGNRGAGGSDGHFGRHTTSPDRTKIES
jgi:hypothetical protein